MILILILLLILILFLFFKVYECESFSNANLESKSFHLLLCTMGKDSIFNMLNSIKDQLNKNDYLTIVFDGPNLPNVDSVKKYVSYFKCNTNVIVEQKNLGYWGHAIRNKYHDLPGDFIFHIDDDDIVVPDGMNIIREHCKNKDTIYIFQIIMANGSKIWKTKDIIETEISTQNGVIPMQLNATSEFTYRYGGDYDFYKKLKQQKIEYVEKVIYKMKP